MDYNNDPGAREPWDWHGKNISLGKTADFEISEELWNDVPQNEEDLSYMLDDETTPVKACGDLAYNVSNADPKEPEECRETYSQAKRRRMLQFNSQDSDQSLSNEEMSLSYLKNGKEDPVKEIFPEVSQWVSDYTIGNASASDYVDLESTETWLADYFNDAVMDFSPEELNFSVADGVQIDDGTEVSAITPSHEQNVVQQTHVPRTTCNIIFKGRKSFIHMPTKLASSVAYPFAFIKPSGAHGDVTLKEINQRIQTPSPSKSNQSIDDDPSAYPKSAFSGKPVVGKTKIRTEGGKGSITITRTKG
ncbi:hypothetical protein AAZV13_03G048700 [Glycine max]